jgi:hypothetical protein
VSLRRSAQPSAAPSRGSGAARLRSGVALGFAILATAVAVLCSPTAQAASGHTGSTAGSAAPGLRTTTARSGATARDVVTAVAGPGRETSGPTAAAPRRPRDLVPTVVAPSAGPSPDGAHHVPAHDALPRHTASPAPPPAFTVLPALLAGHGSAGRTVVAAPGRSPPAAGPPSSRRPLRPALP